MKESKGSVIASGLGYRENESSGQERDSQEVCVFGVVKTGESAHTKPK